MAELADAQASGACGSNIVWVQVPFPASREKEGGDRWSLPSFSMGSGVLLNPCGFPERTRNELTVHSVAVPFLYFFAYVFRSTIWVSLKRVQ